MIAGLLNVLAIYDAWGGPVDFDAEDEKKRDPNKRDPNEKDAPTNKDTTLNPS